MSNIHDLFPDLPDTPMTTVSMMKDDAERLIEQNGDMREALKEIGKAYRTHDMNDMVLRRAVREELDKLWFKYGPEVW